MIEKITEQVRKIRLSQRQKDAKVIFQALNDQGKIAWEQHGASQAVVNLEVNSQKEPKKLDPKKIQSTGELLVSGLNNPEIPLASDTEALAASVVPILQEELTRKIPNKNEIQIDAKTTVIQPDSKSRQMAVSRRGFLVLAQKAAVTVGITPIVTAVLAADVFNNRAIQVTNTYDNYVNELNNARQKFEAAYPEKPIQYTSREEIRENLRYKEQRDEDWDKVRQPIESWKSSERYSLPDRIVISGIIGLGTCVLSWLVRCSIQFQGNESELEVLIDNPLKYL